MDLNVEPEHSEISAIRVQIVDSGFDLSLRRRASSLVAREDISVYKFPPSSLSVLDILDSRSV